MYPTESAMSASIVRNPNTEPAWLDDDTLRAVRPQVRHLLESSAGFRELDPEKQQDIARTMVRVASYMANPQGLAKQELTPGKGVLAKEQALSEQVLSEAQAKVDAVDQAKLKASEKIGTFAGSDFDAGSVRQGADNFRNFVGAVDFPKFVGGLIQNVFQAIVDASIQQMEAYAELLKAVSQTVDQFAADNISMNNARDWLVQKFPEDLDIDTGGEGGTPRLAMKGDDDPEARAAKFSGELQLSQPVTDISDEEQESRLVMGARMQMARSRQQMLSSMVMLGINRIVVTDGLINAKVMFNFRASDEAKRDAKASLHDRKSSMNSNTTAAGAHFGWGGAASVNKNEQKHMTTVSSSVDETSTSSQEMKAKLSGEVRVNFKSDYFPMEKLASPGMIASIQGNATPFDPNTKSAGASAPATP